MVVYRRNFTFKLMVEDEAVVKWMQLFRSWRVRPALNRRRLTCSFPDMELIDVIRVMLHDEDGRMLLTPVFMAFVLSQFILSPILAPNISISFVIPCIPANV